MKKHHPDELYYGLAKVKITVPPNTDGSEWDIALKCYTEIPIHIKPVKFLSYQCLANRVPSKLDVENIEYLKMDGMLSECISTLQIVLRCVNFI
jgi:hypothetical protein